LNHSPHERLTYGIEHGDGPFIISRRLPRNLSKKILVLVRSAVRVRWIILRTNDSIPLAQPKRRRRRLGYGIVARFAFVRGRLPRRRRAAFETAIGCGTAALKPRERRREHPDVPQIPSRRRRYRGRSPAAESNRIEQSSLRNEIVSTGC